MRLLLLSLALVLLVRGSSSHAADGSVDYALTPTAIEGVQRVYDDWRPAGPELLRGRSCTGDRLPSPSPVVPILVPCVLIWPLRPDLLRWWLPPPPCPLPAIRTIPPSDGNRSTIGWAAAADATAGQITEENSIV